MADSEPGPMAEQDRHKPDREKLNKSGYVFQIAVEAEIRRTVDSHGWRVVESEVPAEGYLDLLLQFHDQFLAAIECKAPKKPEPWIFLLPDRTPTSVHRCRFEWFNGKAVNLDLQYPGANVDRVFCDEFNMELASPEAKYAVTKHKGSTVQTLEAVSSKLLSQVHNLLADERRARDSALEIAVPIIVTTAPLLTCSFSTDEDHLLDGVLEADEASFQEVPFVRFRKSLVPGPSDWYSEHPLSLKDQYADSTRTVLVVQACEIVSLLDGLGSLRHDAGVPPRYSNPPRVREDGWLA